MSFSKLLFFCLLQLIKLNTSIGYGKYRYMATSSVPYSPRKPKETDPAINLTASKHSLTLKTWATVLPQNSMININ